MKMGSKQRTLVTAHKADCPPGWLLMVCTCKQFRSSGSYILPFVSHQLHLHRPVYAGPPLSLTICINVYRGVKSIQLLRLQQGR